MMSLFRRASQIIKGGGVVVVATETFYGLAADPFNAAAVDEVYRLKDRSVSKPLPLIAADVDIVVKLLRNPHPRLLCLINKFWPGSLTIVLSADISMAHGVINPQGKIAVRIPPACPARTCAALSGGWITATSANISDEFPPDRISSIPREILTQAAMVLDSGPTRGGLPSTIIEVLNDGEYSLLREGVLSFELISGCRKRLTKS